MSGVGRRARAEWPFLALTAVVDIALFLVSAGQKASGTEKLLVVITATTLVALLRLLYETAHTGEAHAEVLLDVDDALHRARALQNPARDSVLAMWTLFPYDKALKEYFRKTLASGLYTHRLIALSPPAIDDIGDHLWESREHILAGSYRVDLVHNVSYEVLIVDHEVAAMFHYPGRGIGCLFATHNDQMFVRVMENIFHVLSEEGIQLPADKLTGTQAELVTWLRARAIA